MLISLFALFLFFFLLLYRFRGKDLLYPSILTSGIFTIGSLFAYLGNIGWQVQISWLAPFVVVLSFSFILLGEQTAIVIVKKQKIRKNNGIIFSIPIKVIIILLVFSLLVAYYYFQKMKYFAAMSVLADRNDTQFLQAVRDYRFNERESLGAALSIPTNFVIVEGYFFTFLFLNNALVLGIKNAFRKYKLYLSFIIPFSIILGLSGARIGFLQFIVFIGLAYLILGKYYDKKMRLNFKFLLLATSGVLLFFTIFYLLGTLTGKVSDDNVFEKYYIYAGSPIVDLDLLLNNMFFQLEAGSRLGICTFDGIYRIIGHVIDVPDFDIKSDEFIFFKNGSGSNIYTAYAFYYEDWREIGLVLVNFFIGFFTAAYYRSLFRWKNIFLHMIFISYFFYGLIGNLFAAELTRSLIAGFQLQFIFWIYIFLFVCRKCNYIFKIK